MNTIVYHRCGCGGIELIFSRQTLSTGHFPTMVHSAIVYYYKAQKKKKMERRNGC
jgi:hypothetical protein